jgi:hypothetical protein
MCVFRRCHNVGLATVAAASFASEISDVSDFDMVDAELLCLYLSCLWHGTMGREEAAGLARCHLPMTIHARVVEVLYYRQKEFWMFSLIRGAWGL